MPTKRDEPPARTAQAIRFLGICRAAFNRLISLGILNPSKDGRENFFDWQELRDVKTGRKAARKGNGYPTRADLARRYRLSKASIHDSVAADLLAPTPDFRLVLRKVRTGKKVRIIRQFRTVETFDPTTVAEFERNRQVQNGTKRQLAARLNRRIETIEAYEKKGLISSTEGLAKTEAGQRRKQRLYPDDSATTIRKRQTNGWPSEISADLEGSPARFLRTDEAEKTTRLDRHRLIDYFKTGNARRIRCPKEFWPRVGKCGAPPFYWAEPDLLKLNAIPKGQLSRDGRGHFVWQPPKPSAAPAVASAPDENAMLGPIALAPIFGLTLATTRKRLERFRAANVASKDWTELENVSSREERYLYRLSAVRPVLVTTT